MKSKLVAVSPLEAHLGYWLRFVSNQVSHSFSLKLGERGVTVAEWVVLRELYEREAMAPSALAERIGMTRVEDRRYQALAITAKGRALLPKLAALADENDAAFFGHLNAAEQERIKSAMREIVRRHGLKSVPVD